MGTVQGFHGWLSQLRAYPPEQLIQPELKHHRQQQDRKLRCGGARPRSRSLQGLRSRSRVVIGPKSSQKTRFIAADAIRPGRSKTWQQEPFSQPWLRLGKAMRSPRRATWCVPGLSVLV